MSSIHKVAIITGASQGIGAALVTAYRKLGYAVVANSRSIGKSDDPDVLTLPGVPCSSICSVCSRTQSVVLSCT
jgi:NAD(P)-dependent dehydrogenase (short-subunit alcohol dehydrogenase family)